MLYMTKHYAIKCQQERKLSIIKMRTLKWISGHIRQDKIRNTIIKEKKLSILVAPIVKDMVDFTWNYLDKYGENP